MGHDIDATVVETGPRRHAVGYSYGASRCEETALNRDRYYYFVPFEFTRQRSLRRLCVAAVVDKQRRYPPIDGRQPMLNADRSNLLFFIIILVAASFLSAQQKTEGPLLESCSLYFRLHSARSESQRGSNSGDDARIGEGSKEKSRHMRPHVSFRQYSCF